MVLDMEILPGVGIGDIRFGMVEREVIHFLGEPDEINDFEYVENEAYRELDYCGRGLTFSFDADDEYRLGHISVTEQGYTLFSQDVLGYTLEKTREFISSFTDDVPAYEDTTWGKPEVSELLTVDGYGLMFWFKSGVLDELVISYLRAGRRNRDMANGRCGQLRKKTLIHFPFLHAVAVSGDIAPQ